MQDVHHKQYGDEDAAVTAASAGPPLLQSWRAGDAMECVYTSGDLKICNGLLLFTTRALRS